MEPHFRTETGSANNISAVTQSWLDLPFFNLLKHLTKTTAGKPICCDPCARPANPLSNHDRTNPCQLTGPLLNTGVFCFTCIPQPGCVLSYAEGAPPSPDGTVEKLSFAIRIGCRELRTQAVNDRIIDWDSGILCCSEREPDNFRAWLGGLRAVKDSRVDFSHQPIRSLAAHRTVHGFRLVQVSMFAASPGSMMYAAFTATRSLPQFMAWSAKTSLQDERSEERSFYHFYDMFTLLKSTARTAGGLRTSNKGELRIARRTTYGCKTGATARQQHSESWPAWTPPHLQTKARLDKAPDKRLGCACAPLNVRALVLAGSTSKSSFSLPDGQHFGSIISRARLHYFHDVDYALGSAAFLRQRIQFCWAALALHCIFQTETECLHSCVHGLIKAARSSVRC